MELTLLFKPLGLDPSNLAHFISPNVWRNIFILVLINYQYTGVEINGRKKFERLAEIHVRVDRTCLDSFTSAVLLVPLRRYNKRSRDYGYCNIDYIDNWVLPN
jgi:hypothetical protein